MKITEYKCDKCGTCSNDIRHWLEIGSDTGNGLFINNNCSDAGLISMDKYSNIHFCSKECLNGYLFGEHHER